jgi:polyketide synthase PksM
MKPPSESTRKPMNAHWVINAANSILQGHAVYGEPLLPGLAYIDMLYQVFRKEGHDYRRLRLRNLSIYRPLAASAGEQIDLDLRAVPNGDARWDIVVEGRTRGDGAMRRYATAEMWLTAPVSFDETIDVAEIESSSAGIDLEEAYARCRQRELVHRGFMKADGSAYLRDDAVYVDCRLGDAARFRASSFLFHPSLIDAVAVCGSVSLRLGGPDDSPLALPLSFESFQASAPLQERCIGRLRRASIRNGADLRTISLDLFDESGAKIAELTNFASKVVTDRRSISAPTAPPQPQTVYREPLGRALHNKDDVEAAVRELIADRLQRPVEEIGRSIGFYDLGIDSADMLELVGAIDRLVGRSLPPTLLFEYPTVAQLATHLAAQKPVTAEATPAIPAPQAIRPAAPPLPDDAIAIVGMAGRFPEANDIRQFWKNLKAGKDSIIEVPPERWDWRRFAELRSPSGKPLSRWGGFLDDADCFDPQFFRMSPRQAELTDPQERLFLEACWEAMEDAGYTPRTLAGGDARRRVGVFAGVMHKDYMLIANESQRAGGATPLPLSNAAIANRVSYVCDFHGPSMSVDTVCSSSLVAIHLAILNLRAGECEAALAGGVNLSLHPGKYLTYGMMDMLASDGRCHTFGSGGDGYVSSEAVGSVLLKTLRKAVADGDHIYAVIRGSATNHVGAVSGFNVPSPTAQEDVIAACLDRAGIDPRTISYVEAHGTGTSLGDPIEIEGLTHAYRRRTDDAQFCAIGSVKSNIGHAESAAGVCGLIKAALQLHHRTLVASLQAEELNPHVDWQQTPFFVQRETRHWQDAAPRRAAVSSFGATGTNVHLVLEEWLDPNPVVDEPDAAPADVLIPISAKDDEALRRSVERLMKFLEDPPQPVALADLAYTLQVGREAMDVRAAFIANGIATLLPQFDAFLGGRRLGQRYRSDAGRSPHRINPFDDGDLDSIVQKWVDAGKLGKLAELWVSGVAVPWERLRWRRTPRRISLPTYPFARVRCWIPSAVPLSMPAVSSVSELHPLLHANTSAFAEQRFTSTFTGDEWFLRDHVVGGSRVLPGVAYLEMARAAVERAAGAGTISLRDVVWPRAMVVEGGPVSVNVGAEQDEDGEIRFDVYSTADETVVHAQGRASAMAGDRPTLDLDALRAACDRMLSAAACYAALEGAGFRYGPAHRGLESVSAGKDMDGARFVLADLIVPPSIEATGASYVLHPSVLDAALQASVGLSLGEAVGGTTLLGLPFALARADIYAATSAHATAVVRRGVPVKSTAGARPMPTIDVDVCDEQGRVCVRLIGLTSRPAEKSSSGTLLFARDWMPAPAPRDRVVDGARWLFAHPCYGDRLALPPGIRCELLPPAGDDAAEELASCAAELLIRLQQIATAGAAIVQVVVPEDESTLSALSALLKTAELEQLKLRTQMIELPHDASADDLLKAVEENAAAEDTDIRGVGRDRTVARLVEVQSSNAPAIWRPRGVYLIAGGAGGLGSICAEAIMTAVPDARIILAGRSKEAVLPGARNGATVVYRPLDVTDGVAVATAVAELMAEHGTLHGVIHAAGLLRDGLMRTKMLEDARAVWAPKLRGTINLDRATEALPLDCFVLFSSTVGVFGNVGQADYALANAFLDRYAEARQRRVQRGAAHGRTLSIDWPLWAAGGMKVSPQRLEQMSAVGLQPLTSDAGISALYAAFASGRSQVVVLAGDVPRIRQRYGATASAATHEVLRDAPRGLTPDRLREKTVQYLSSLLSTTFKLPPGQLDPSVSFDNYGLDSIVALQMVNSLETDFGNLSKTLFFEYDSVDALADYFVAEHRDQLKTILLPAAQTEPARSENEETVAPVAVSRLVRGRSRVAAAPRRLTAENAPSDIAIIGLSGRYPQSPTLAEFWANLASGHDCITEIPSERWDYRRYFDPEKQTADKSYTKWGGFIEGVDEFDPLFFNISPREALQLDPQVRLFLQCAYATIEDAGYTPELLRTGRAEGSPVGVFAGVMYSEYQLLGSLGEAGEQALAVGGPIASIANRVSYHLNFHGPSVTVDTMCSSSLTSLHLACQSLLRGECDAAIAGGVNVSIHPSKYFVLSRGRYASSDGRCRSFGAGGDGYVPGEGVGTVLLKPLAAAEADGDHIYGVIKGTAVNHGGRTSGYTVPNPQAQAAVIARALETAGVAANAVSYIEAHGTGTALGDPIEIASLAKAFGTEEKQFCAIGSVKSNIGHCESAAGIAGLTKVLLQMRHRTLVASLHAEELNPHIDFAQTPFVVQRTAAPWGTSPRIAGLSSFGAGGANAHVIVAEYEPAPRPVATGPVVIVLSAKSAEQLRQRVELLVAVLENEVRPELAEIAYTLQVGREAMEMRLACVATSAAEGQAKLTAYLGGESAIDELYSGDVKRRSALPPVNADLPLHQLAELWTRGGEIPWAKLYGDVTPRRVSLPTYPFAAERYWVPPIAEAAALHPLLHRNTSTLAAQRFTSVFTGEEFFFTDHVVQGRRLFPAAAYVELARAAVTKACDVDEDDVVVRLHDLVFVRPLVADGAPCTVDISLRLGESGALTFEIASRDENGKPVVHARGRASVAAAEAAPAIDLGAIERACAAGAGEVLATLPVTSPAAGYRLHPALLDGAFQASDGLPSAAERTVLIGIELVEIWRAAAAESRAWARESSRSVSIDICDPDGSISVRIQGATYQMKERAMPLGTEVIASLVWEPFVPAASTATPAGKIVIIGGTPEQVAAIPRGRPIAVNGDWSEDAIAGALRSIGDLGQVIWILGLPTDAALTSDAQLAAQAEGSLLGLRLIKGLVAAGYATKPLALTVITERTQAVRAGEQVVPAHASVHGLMGSAAKEYPTWQVRVVDVGADGLPVESVIDVSGVRSGATVAYRDGEWFRQRWVRCLMPPATAPRVRSGGVYVVIGGAGGVGEAFSEHVIAGHGAQVVWIGRRLLDSTITGKQDRLATHGPRPHYITADASDRAALAAARDEIIARFGAIHGLVVSVAGPLDDSLARVSEESFRAGLAPKVDVTVRAAQVFGSESLDFALVFSSLGAFDRAGGQASYAAGCVFQDAYARALAAEWPCPVRIVNWGYWGEVGIGKAIPQAFKTRLRQSGNAPIDRTAAMAAIDRLLASPIPQIAYFMASSDSTVIAALDLIPGDEVTIASPAPAVLRELPTHSALAPDVDADAHARGEALERLLAKLLFVRLQASGLLDASSPARATLPPLYERWLDHSLRLLKTHAAPDPATAWAEWEAFQAAAESDSARRSRVALLEATIRALPDILQDRRAATDVIFPNASMHLVSSIYRQNRVADYFNAVVVDALVAYVVARIRRDPAVRLRLIEIGAGTGGTSTAIFAGLAPYADHIGEYCYSDISHAFVLHGEKQYRPIAPYLTTKRFDVEQPLAAQGIEAGAYDVAIATNVLHATRDMRRTMRQTKAVLKANGIVLINEMTASSIFLHLTFGLLPGWWAFTDHALRLPGSPALAPSTWRRLLLEDGFTEVRQPAEELVDLGQQLLVAQSDGVIRQPVAAASVESPPSTGRAVAAAVDEPTLRDRVAGYLKTLVAQTLSMSPKQLDPAEPLETYGIDSILVQRITHELSEAFGPISKIALFEHQTIEALADHLLSAHRETAIRLFGSADRDERRRASSAAMSVTPPASAPARRQSAGIARAERSAIAIVGLSGRYPNAPTLDVLWRRLRDGESCITEVPASRWNWRDFYGSEKGRWGTIYTKWGGFIDDVDCFDPLFFNISPREALNIDPQERLFLQECYACIADAGYTPAGLSPTRQVGVFAGVTNGGYRQRSLYWSIPNRVSAMFGFHGPSLAVDTACSGSLTAIHLACEQLASGRIDCAIAGGVNVIAGPLQYMRLAAMTMLTESDACRAFGAGADGFVDAEGVGVVLLKPLVRALEDGDHVYGVIKGSAINHGGKASGYTTPNPNAQAEVIARALADAGVPARAVSYVEAHGTGTALGDPIEIAGLVKAFGADTGETQFCAIGSVKSNIGHCESAAGIAGLTKLLLQMKHRMIVKSLHSGTPNPNIDFAATPFVVPQTTTPWGRPVVREQGIEREYPRIAGLSSFGAGGSNAYLVVEELVDEQPVASSFDEPAIIVLSAKSEAALRESAERLLAVLDRTTDAGLRDIAYTLQVGREAMESRLACVVDSIAELESTLRAYLAGDTPRSPFSACTDTTRNRDALEALGPDDDVAALIGAWAAKGKFSKIADLWTKGMAVEWDRLHHDPKPRRVSLPTYPFAKERYWAPDAETPLPAASYEHQLHPLVHENTSTLDKQRFTSRFTGDEFFFRDHVVQGERVLPAAAHLELARTAAALAAGSGTEASRLENIVFIRPIVAVGRPVQIHIALEPAEDGAIAFTTYSEADDAPEPVVHSRGVVRFAAGATPAILDLNAIEERCGEITLDGAACYARFSELGLAYGPAFRALERLRVGRDERGETLVAAALALPAAAGPADAFVLHPSMLDAALQAAIGVAFATPSDGKRETNLPFAVERVDVLAAPPAHARAVVRMNNGDRAAGTGRGFDVDLTDADGRVCVRVTGFRTRVVPRNAARGEGDELTLAPVWERVASKPGATSRVPTLVIGADAGQQRAWLDLCADVQFVALDASDSIEEIQGKLRAAGEVGRVVWIVAPAGEIALTGDVQLAAQAAGSRLGLRLIKSLVAEGYGTKALALTVITQQTQAVHAGERVVPMHASVHGLMGSAAKEYAAWQVRVVDVGAGAWPAEAMLAMPGGRSGETAAYRNGEWFRQRWERCELSPATAPRYRHGGVYVVLGGAGGLGEAFSEHVIASRGAQVVWIGRRPLDATIAAKQDRLTSLGPRPHYIAADATDRAVLAGARGEIVALFGEIHGLVHATIVLNDQGLARMDEEAFAAAARAKIDVAVNMAEVFQHNALDFVLFFSALQSTLRIAGQSNYAAGCTFADAYADALRQSWRCAVKVVNWGYWGSAGVVAAGEYQARMAQFGLASIDPKSALEMVDRLLASTTDRVAYLKTTGPDAAVLRALEPAEETPLPRTEATRPAPLPSSSVALDASSLPAYVRRGVRASITEAVRVDPERIKDDQAFSDYGVDSIVAVSLVNAINAKLGLTLNTTVLFDYGSVAQLVDHIVRNYRDVVSANLTPAATPAEAPAAPPVATPARAAAGRPRKRFRAPSPVAVADDGRRCQRVLIDGPGSIDDLRLVEDAVAPLGDDDVLISVRAFSLNFADVLCVSGLYPNMPPYPFTPGAEVSGVVAAAGRAVKKVGVGDAVVVLTGQAMGGHATALLAPANRVFKMPASLSFEEACALPAVALTSIAAFHKIRPERGERILIQTATGGTGLAMLQLARHHGLEILATAGSEAKLEHLRSLGVANVINYVESDFEAEVRRLTGGAGVDVVINTLSGDALQKGLNCLARGGRYLEIAMAGLKSARSINLSVLDANQTFFSLDIRKLLSEHPDLLTAYWNEMVALVGDGVLKPMIGRTFPLAAVSDAYRWMSDRGHIGKVIVRVPEESRFAIAGAAPERPRADFRPEHDRIAIVGMSGRFGRAADLEELWEALAAGEELIEEPTRWTLPPQKPDDPPQCRRGGFLRDIDRFDALFFNISGVEATHMDPQQRLFLEEAWKAVEDAGYAGAAIEGARCGVYAGCTAGDYAQLLDESRPPQAFWGNAGAVIPARIAYHLDLHGPAVAVDTACSSSLMALHLACQALRAREIDVALAGGVFVQCTPGFFGLANQAGMLSPTGHTYAFDARADGFVPGEGVGIVVLKRLADAEADGDHIYGVIRGSAVNQDGTTNGITAPSGRSQERLEREAYETFAIHPEEIQYVEAHGTGTRLGDPIEFSALTRAFAKDTAKKKFCAIGSIKSNIGHAANAAGIAGVMKVLLALKHRQLPPSLNYEHGNPEIDFENSAFSVCTRLQPWEVAPGEKRCAAVSSFGISGTNAHVVIEEAPARAAIAPSRPGYLVVLSARSADRLRRQVERLAAHCRPREVSCADVSYTLLAGRRHFAHRLACVARDMDDLLVSLTSWLDGGIAPRVRLGVVKDGASRDSADEPLDASACDDLERLMTIAERYVDGQRIDSSALFAGQQPRRISLPTYPFAEDRYWVRTRRAEMNLAAAVDVAGKAPGHRRETGDEHLDAFRDGLIDLDAIKALIEQGMVS